MGKKVSASEAQSGHDSDFYLKQALEAEKAYEISLSEIVGLQSYKELCTGGDYQCNNDDLYNFLYSLGLDIDQEVDEQYCAHRNKLNEIVTCARWVGVQRTDKEWLDFKKEL